MFKKILAVLTAAVLFTSCGIFSKDPKESRPVDGKIIAKELGENVLNAIQNEDVDALADLFCQYTVDEYGDDLKPEIQNLYDYIDGEIVSHDEIETRSNDAKLTAEDGPVISSYHAIIENVITDNGNRYSISCKGYTIYKDHQDLVGFVQIYVTDENKFDLLHQNNVGSVDKSEFSYHIGHMPEKPLV